MGLECASQLAMGASYQREWLLSDADGKEGQRKIKSRQTAWERWKVPCDGSMAQAHDCFVCSQIT